MVTTNELYELVRNAWSQVPTPARDDLGMMEWMWGKSSALAFMGIAPIDVDTDSSGFHASTPLMDLPPPCRSSISWHIYALPAPISDVSGICGSV